MNDEIKILTPTQAKEEEKTPPQNHQPSKEENGTK